MTELTCCTVILAAGEGSRMRSNIPKALHKIAGLSMIGHILKTVKTYGCDQVAVVTGFKAEQVEKEARKLNPNVLIYEQKQRRGTADAVLAAKEFFENQDKGYVLIVYTDTPLVTTDDLTKIKEQLLSGADIVVVGFKTDHPYGYGRLIEKDGKLIDIVEEVEATDRQKEIHFCNSGILAVKSQLIKSLLSEIDTKNNKGEYYLTDIVKIGYRKKLKVKAVEVDQKHVMGVNTQMDLSAAESFWQENKRREIMLSGVKLNAPHTVYFSHDTIIASDVIVEPYVIFGCNVQIEKGSRIASFSYLEGTRMDENVTIGPFTRLRTGTTLASDVRVGNFCELKATHVGRGTKINHLSYVGNASIGQNANLGAGVVTCNYDGYNKWQTKIGDDNFIGSNSSLIAPVELESNVYIASGSVITENVPPYALGISRSYQINKQGYVRKLWKKLKSK